MPPKRSLGSPPRAARGAYVLALALASCALLACAPEDGQKLVTAAGETECATCHVDEWMATSAPPHAPADFTHDCARCHDEQQWGPAPGFAHVATFPLTLGHAAPGCADCHTGGYEPGATRKECVDCHAARAASVVDPVHAGLSTSCFACHRTDTFWPARFVHSWPLQGVHALTSCRSCHGAGSAARYEGTAPACLNCHADDQERANASSPAHRSYSSACDSCHSFASFRDL